MQVLPSALISVPACRRRASAASRAGLEESGRTATDSGSESSEPVPERVQCSRPPKLRTVQGRKMSRLKSSLAVSSFACRALDGVPWEEIERNAPDIWFVHFETLPIVVP